MVIFKNRLKGQVSLIHSLVRMQMRPAHERNNILKCWVTAPCMLTDGSPVAVMDACPGKHQAHSLLMMINGNYIISMKILARQLIWQIKNQKDFVNYRISSRQKLQSIMYFLWMIAWLKDWM